jgi:4'-phosphopantetheinyl transferase
VDADPVVDVVFAREPGADDPCTEAERLLSPAELARARRFQFDADRRRFVATRALVRATLSRRAAVDPEHWQIEIDAQGRPFVAGPSEAAALVFSAAHTDGLVLCAVARGRAVGVDVERVRERAPLEVAGHFFAPAEVAALGALAPERQAEGFFTCWTLKEAYAKARGLGLSLPLDGFAFDLDGSVHPRVTFAPALGDDPGAWRFFSLRPAAGYRAAVCVGRADGAEVRLATTWASAPPEDPTPDQR